MKVLFFSISLFLTFTIYSQDYSIQLHHSNMEIEIGYPAILSAGERYPSLMGHFITEGEFYCEIINTENDSIYKIYPSTMFSPGDILIFEFNDYVYDPGIYIIDIQLKLSEKVVYETFYFSVLNLSQIPRWSSVIVHYDEQQKLRYIPDFRGNRIPDFSTAGYKGGGVPFPQTPVNIRLEPQPGDDTERIQAAINDVSRLDPDNNGIRGAVVLSEGIYTINSSLSITTSGVIIRGEGNGSYREFLLDPDDEYDFNKLQNSLKFFDGTLIIATGEERRTLINVIGETGAYNLDQDTVKIIDQYVPVGAKSFRVENTNLFSVGDKIIIERIGNADWISKIGMDAIPQRPVEGSRPPVQWRPFDISYETIIMDIDGDRLFIEGSISCSIEERWGGGFVYKYDDDQRIKNIAIKNIRAISFWMPDEFGGDGTNHADRFLEVGNSKDIWVENVTMEHFFAIGGAIYIAPGSKQVTIKNSSNLIADKKFYSGEGYRHDRINIATGVEVGRYGFHIRGQSVLVTGCYTLNNRRSYSVGPRLSGPNVFLDCKAENSLTTSEPHHRWSVGGLYDNVYDNISFMNRLYHGTGQGWAGANYVAWNTRGRLIIEQPPTAQNWAIGHKGEIRQGQFFEYHKREGYREKYNQYVLPRSLYIQQLVERKGKNIIKDMSFQLNQYLESQNTHKVNSFPNPADYFTIFSINLEISSHLIMSVYAASGVLLAKVDFGIKDAGYHEFVWKTTDDSGRPLSNGIYFYTFQIDDQVYSNKFMIKR